MSSNTQKSNEENIPLADDDPQVIITDNMEHSMDSLPADASSPGLIEPLSLDQDEGMDEQEEKARLIAEVLELQITLDDISQRVALVKEENTKLRTENLVLEHYIEDLMSASSVFQSTILYKY